MNSGSVPEPILSIRRLEKRYASGLQALKGVDLEIRRGEIFALLGPNGAGKTTLINIVCGIVNPSAGTVSVGGHDILSDWRAARDMIGLGFTHASPTVRVRWNMARSITAGPAKPKQCVSKSAFHTGRPHCAFVSASRHDAASESASAALTRSKAASSSPCCVRMKGTMCSGSPVRC